MKKIIVFSLWGENPMYWVGALRNIELAKKYYPGWICRFYIDEKCNSDLVNKITGENVEVILMKSNDYKFRNISDRFDHDGLFWRFLSLSDEDVSVVLSRDCDSRFSKRESEAVSEWLSSDKDFHIMRDHPYHTVPILSGMWGARNNILINIKSLLDKWSYHSIKGIFNAEDQDFLGQFIYPIVKNNCLEHSEFGIHYGNQIKTFPTKRENYEFVGDVFDENNIRHPDYWQLIKNAI